MNVRYDSRRYSVKIITALKIYWYKFVLICFRTWHFLKRTKLAILDVRNIILYVFVAAYFVGTYMGNMEDGLSFASILKETIDESIEVVLLTLFAPILTECIIRENDRKKSLKKRYSAWHGVAIQLNDPICRILGEGEYLSLSTYDKNDLKKIINDNMTDMDVLRNCIKALKSGVDIIMKNSLDYSLEDDEVECLQISCINTESHIEDIRMHLKERNINVITEALIEIIYELRTVDFLLGSLWMRDTLYNYKIIRLIEKDDRSIVGQRCYKRYVRQ